MKSLPPSLPLVSKRLHLLSFPSSIVWSVVLRVPNVQWAHLAHLLFRNRCFQMALLPISCLAHDRTFRHFLYLPLFIWCTSLLLLIRCGSLGNTCLSLCLVFYFIWFCFPLSLFRGNFSAHPHRPLPIWHDCAYYICSTYIILFILNNLTTDRIQCWNCRIQEHLIHCLGRRWSGM